MQHLRMGVKSELRDTHMSMRSQSAWGGPSLHVRHDHHTPSRHVPGSSFLAPTSASTKDTWMPDASTCPLEAGAAARLELWVTASFRIRRASRQCWPWPCGERSDTSGSGGPRASAGPGPVGRGQILQDPEGLAPVLALALWGEVRYFRIRRASRQCWPWPCGERSDTSGSGGPRASTGPGPVGRGQRQVTGTVDSVTPITRYNHPNHPTQSPQSHDTVTPITERCADMSERLSPRYFQYVIFVNLLIFTSGQHV